MKDILLQEINKGYETEGGYDTARSISIWFTLKFQTHCINHLRRQFPEESTLIIKMIMEKCTG